MLVIRLLRIGKENQPSFKIVVTDKRNPPRGGRFVEQVGLYNPLTKEKAFKRERIQYWLSQGAKPSATVHNLLVKEGIIEGAKIPVHKKAKKKEEPKEAEVKTQPAEKEEVSKGEAPKKEPPKEETTEKPPKEEKEKAPKEEVQEKEKPEKEPVKDEKPKEKKPKKEESSEDKK